MHIQRGKHYYPLTTLEKDIQQCLGTITTSASITIIIIIILIVEIYVILLNVFILYMFIIVYNPNMKGLISTLSRYAYLICRSIHAFPSKLYIYNRNSLLHHTRIYSQTYNRSLSL